MLRSFGAGYPFFHARPDTIGRVQTLVARPYYEQGKEINETELRCHRNGEEKWRIPDIHRSHCERWSGRGSEGDGALHYICSDGPGICKNSQEQTRRPSEAGKQSNTSVATPESHSSGQAGSR